MVLPTIYVYYYCPLVDYKHDRTIMYVYLYLIKLIYLKIQHIKIK
jgi:hypothetical protein